MVAHVCNPNTGDEEAGRTLDLDLANQWFPSSGTDIVSKIKVDSKDITDLASLWFTCVSKTYAYTQTHTYIQHKTTRMFTILGYCLVGGPEFSLQNQCTIVNILDRQSLKSHCLVSLAYLKSSKPSRELPSSLKGRELHEKQHSKLTSHPHLHAHSHMCQNKHTHTTQYTYTHMRTHRVE